ncbi:MAG: hypothetical protein AAF679_00965 [Pseudomonadota bacterium]
MQQGTPPEMPGGSLGKAMLNFGLLCLVVAVLGGLWVISQRDRGALSKVETASSQPLTAIDAEADAARFFDAMPWAAEGWTRSDLAQTQAVDKVIGKFKAGQETGNFAPTRSLEQSKLGTLYENGPVQVLIVQSHGYAPAREGLTEKTIADVPFEVDEQVANMAFARHALEPKRTLLLYANQPLSALSPFVKSLNLRVLQTPLPTLDPEVARGQSQ